jgi:small-conductance mechanosensitive channel
VGGCAAIAVAVVANLVGNITLAAMLTDATLVSGYLGLFLLAAGSVVRSWAAFVFRPVAEKLMNQADHAGSLMQVLSRLFDFGLMLAWLYGTLDAFRILRPLQAWLAAAFAWKLEFGNLAITFGGTVLFVVSVYLSFWIAKTVRGILAEDVLPRMSLPRGVANSASTITYYVLLMLGLVVALAAAGFEVSQLAIVLGALSLGVGLGLQAVVNNFVSGLILMFERPIQPGDTVEVAGTAGTVREIGMRSTTFITFEGADVVVPNGMLLSEKLINWTLSSNTRRVDIPVGVAYGSDPEQVRALLLQVAQRTERVVAEPPPAVLFAGFGASSLDFSVRVWARFDDSPGVRSALGLAIHAALRDAGIEIPFPQQDLRLRSVEGAVFDRLRGKADPEAADSA